MKVDFAIFNDLTAEFDYLKLIDILKDYANPRDQITKLIRNQIITRVKKGVYVLGPKFRKPHSNEILANIIYGPSYVSGISALAFYNLIPERISVVSSRTPNRNKVFDTPVGRFTYDYLRMSHFQISVDRIQLDTERSFLIATREKTLVEMVTKMKDIGSADDLLDWFDSMRIDRNALQQLRVKELQMLRREFDDVRIDLLIKLVRNKKHA